MFARNDKQILWALFAKWGGGDFIEFYFGIKDQKLSKRMKKLAEGQGGYKK